MSCKFVSSGFPTKPLYAYFTSRFFYVFRQSHLFDHPNGMYKLWRSSLRGCLLSPITHTSWSKQHPVRQHSQSVVIRQCQDQAYRRI